ncbi:ABC transporter substrate-binding protein [Rhodobacter sp. SGA-6-6]|uniref:ABC transporter substrate-binding protein n=1 Tax=Rhodobacter sp. SGA-6-6 TaxID=2710882 RepID=UPI0013EC46A3|nr:ABC transporter substrate-binding protein [Rhodobacter sp. SGA-6-6]NGM47857.1 ABC transporter substrate-binding protein [Rhodobacter sp. SGA-6-6]
MTKSTSLLAGVALSTLVVTPGFADEITVYTAYEEDEIAAYVAGAEAAIPGLKINVLRLSTGDLAARIIAEAGNPQADMLWGQAITATMDPQILDQLEPYAPAGIEALDARYRDPENRWFAPTGYMGTFCVNTDRLAEKGLPMPKSWKDLENPAFKGEIEMPDPTSSGTGWLHIISLLQGPEGEEAGWAQLERVDPNMTQYTQSGSKPCKDARAGEVTIGISLGITGVQSVEQGYPVVTVFPEEGAGYELEAAALFKSSKNKEDVKKFMDWLLTPEAVKIYEQYKILITAPGAALSDPAKKAGVPEDLGSILAGIDFTQAAADRDRIGDEWLDKFGR